VTSGQSTFYFSHSAEIRGDTDDGGFRVEADFHGDERYTYR